MKWVIFFFASCGLFIGCAGNQSQINIKSQGIVNVPEECIVCVVEPDNMESDGYLYTKSGPAVAEKTAKVLEQKFSQVVVVDSIEQCELNNANYMVAPTIVHWEDHATGWTARPDIIQIDLKASDLNNDAESAELTFTNRSNIGASLFFEYGNSPPEKLLNEKYTEAVLKLFLKGN